MKIKTSNHVIDFQTFKIALVRILLTCVRTLLRNELDKKQMKKILFSLVIFNLFQQLSFAQKYGQARVDSLLAEIPKAKEDTNKVNLLNEVGYERGTINFLKAKEVLLMAEQLARKLNYQRGLGNTLSNLALVYELQGNYVESLKYQIEALKVREAIEDKSGISFSIHYIGDIYFSQGDISDKASAKEEYNNKALDQFYKSLKVAEEINDKNSIANSFNCIANCYREKKDFNTSLKYYFKAIKIREAEKNKRRLAQTFGQIGALYIEKKEYDTALTYLFKSLDLANQTDYSRTKVRTLGSIGSVYFRQKNYIKAIKYCNESLTISTEIGFLQYVAKANQTLSEIYESPDFEEHNSDKALAYYKAYVAERDSINSKNANQAELQFDFDKKEAIAKAESKKQKLIIVFIALGLLLVLVFSGFIFRSLRNTNIQKNIIEEKNREITDSIEYALRIQTAILPPQRIVKQYLENSFILYKPKDIVAGDFYWMEKVNDLVLFAACDCTGHGVPGAMVSVVCHNALTRAVKEFGFVQPAKILDKTAEIVLGNFSKSEEEIHDGMDISICAFNKNTRTLDWAGANNSLLLICDGQLMETKADKQCIGYNDNIKPFTNHQFILQPDTNIYISTDGFADQFGGQPERKLTKSRFKELLLSIQPLPMQQQARELEKFITDYKKEIEQTDDILVMGVRV